MLAIGFDAAADLQRQLSSRRQNQGTDLIRPGGLTREQTLQHRADEAGGLASASLGRRKHVPAGQNRWNRLLLYWGRSLVITFS